MVSPRRTCPSSGHTSVKWHSASQEHADLLTYPDFSQPFVLETDTSGAGLEAVLAQQSADGTPRPIAYASLSL